MAQASRPIGNDSETYWAASVIDSLHNNVMTNNCSFLEQVSTIHHMNSYFAYGMNYFPSVIGMYSCPEEANYARYSLSVCDSLTNNIKSTEFKDIMAIADLSCHSYFYTQLYVTMFYKINGYEDFEDKDLGFPLQNLGLLRYANERCVFSEEELIKIYFVFDAVCFYKTFYNYLMSLTYDDIQRNKTHDKLIDYAYYIDEISGPIFDTVYFTLPFLLQLQDNNEIKYSLSVSDRCFEYSLLPGFSSLHIICIQLEELIIKFPESGTLELLTKSGYSPLCIDFQNLTTYDTEEVISKVTIDPTLIDLSPIVFGYCDFKQVVKTIYLELLRFACEQNVIVYNSVQSSLIENFIKGVPIDELAYYPRQRFIENERSVSLDYENILKQLS